MTPMSEKMEKASFVEKSAPAIFIVVVVLAFAVGVLWQKVSNIEKGGVADTQGDAAEVQGKLTEDQAAAIPAVSDNDHIMGSKDADIVLIEYSDFECPYCASFHPSVADAYNNNEGKVAVVFRHYPLEAIHPRALPAALASECIVEVAGNDKFWEFADFAFADQENNLTDEGILTFVSDNGVDKTAFQACVNEAKFTDKINEMSDGGSAAGVMGTPATFVLNKKGSAWLVSGADPATLTSTIKEALAE